MTTESQAAKMSEKNVTEKHETAEGAEGLDNPLRAIIVVNSSESPEGDLEERMLDGIQSFEEVEQFFDQFDEKIAYPNENDIKYEVGSDGLVVFVVSTLKLKDQVIEFLDAFSKKTDETREKKESKEEAEESVTKKTKHN